MTNTNTKQFTRHDYRDCAVSGLQECADRLADVLLEALSDGLDTYRLEIASRVIDKAIEDERTCLEISKALASRGVHDMTDCDLDEALNAERSWVAIDQALTDRGQTVLGERTRIIKTYL